MMADVSMAISRLISKNIAKYNEREDIYELNTAKDGDDGSSWFTPKQHHEYERQEREWKDAIRKLHILCLSCFTDKGTIRFDVSHVRSGCAFLKHESKKWDNGPFFLR